MKDKLTALTICLVAMVLLAGCKGSGSASSPFDSGSSTYSSSSSSAGGESVVASAPSSGSSEGSSSGFLGGIGHSPEPATLGLLGSGLVAYALIRLRKKR